MADEFETYDCTGCDAAVWRGRDECWHCGPPKDEETK